MNKPVTPAAVIRGEEHWTNKGSDVRLFLWNKRAGDPSGPAGRVLFVHGPGGIGKTTLLLEMRARARGTGRATVLLDGREIDPSPEGLAAALPAEGAADGTVLLIDGYELRAVPRGRYAFERVKLTIADPFGLARAHVEQGEPQALVVYPRLAALDRLFSEGGAFEQDGRRLLLRRPTGYELHSVREYAEGESLRKVHWRSTARRGRLMVKELEDAPRDEVAILLDGDLRTGAGEGFEVAVRAAGSILQAHLRRGRRCALVVNSAARESQPVTSEGEWRRALEVLAGAEPNARTPAFALLHADGGLAARSLELVVVTSRVDVALVDRLVQRALSRRGASLVYVEIEPRPEPQLLRLLAAGIPVAVVRPGDDLAASLAGHEVRVA